jgi:hypothetical protein
MEFRTCVGRGVASRRPVIGRVQRPSAVQPVGSKHARSTVPRPAYHTSQVLVAACQSGTHLASSACVCSLSPAKPSQANAIPSASSRLCSGLAGNAALKPCYLAAPRAGRRVIPFGTRRQAPVVADLETILQERDACGVRDHERECFCSPLIILHSNRLASSPVSGTKPATRSSTRYFFCPPCDALRWRSSDPHPTLRVGSHCAGLHGAPWCLLCR